MRHVVVNLLEVKTGRAERMLGERRVRRQPVPLIGRSATVLGACPGNINGRVRDAVGPYARRRDETMWDILGQAPSPVR